MRTAGGATHPTVGCRSRCGAGFSTQAARGRPCHRWEQRRVDRGAAMQSAGKRSRRLSRDHRVWCRVGRGGRQTSSNLLVRTGVCISLEKSRVARGWHGIRQSPPHGIHRVQAVRPSTPRKQESTCSPASQYLPYPFRPVPWPRVRKEAAVAAAPRYVYCDTFSNHGISHLGRCGPPLENGLTTVTTAQQPWSPKETVSDMFFLRPRR